MPPDWHNWLKPDERPKVDYHTGAIAELMNNIAAHRKELRPYKIRADMRKMRAKQKGE